MGLVERAQQIVEAKANRMLDQVEDPNEMLDLAYVRMREQVTELRRALVQVGATRRNAELQEVQLTQSIGHLEEQARTAVSHGREDLARKVLSRKAATELRVQATKRQHQQLAAEEAKLAQTLRVLQLRVDAFRSEKEVLKAQYAVSRAGAVIGERRAGISQSIGASGATVTAARDRAAAVDADSRATDALLVSGVLDEVGAADDEVDRELAKLAAADKVEEELAELKAAAAASVARPDGDG